ncbi:MAG: TetR family transcriptional regulator [Solirubrobacteraceae bacterium]
MASRCDEGSHERGRVRETGGLRLGSDGVARGPVEEIQRARLLAAMTRVAAEHGAANVTVALVVERAGVSRRTFYELFADAEACLLATMDEALARTRERVLLAYDPSASWKTRIRAGLVALLGFLDEEPGLACLLIVESLAAGQQALERRRQALACLVAVVEEGRREGRQGSGGAPPPQITGEGVVGGALAVLHGHVVHHEPGSLLGLTNQLMSLIVLPYLGTAAARRELSQPLPVAKPRPSAVPPPSDPFKEAGMRLTYRTMQVLNTIAEHPGASNKLIGTHAGISDPGQMSKLLSRLERLGLVSNSGEGHALGRPNAWTLTAIGSQVQHSIGAHTEGVS